MKSSIASPLVESKPSILKLLLQLWKHINPRRRGHYVMLLILMLIASFTEIISVGAVLPFLGILTAPERVFKHPIAQPFINALEITEPIQLLLPITISFIVATIIAGSMRLLLLYVSTRISQSTGAELSINIYRRTLYQPYEVHCARNSSEILNAIYSKAKSVIGIISATITLIKSSAMIIFILIFLLFVDPLIAIISIGGFGLIYAIITKITRKRLLANSQRIARESNQVIKSLQEGLGGIRDILIAGSQEVYCKIYRKSDFALRDATGNNIFISTSPRFFIEALGMILIALLAYSLAMQDDGVSKAIPILGTLALGAQRLLPVLQQVYSSLAIIQGSQVSLQDTLILLNQPLPEYAIHPNVLPIPFKHEIKLNQVGFKYNMQSTYVLKNINLTISKGSRLGIIGTTGSGKSTLLDIVMGLLQPTEGKLEIDNQVVDQSNKSTWQTHVAHVPQAIFLADCTIEENIAFGELQNKINTQRVRQAAQQAQIAESIESWPKKYQTLVGERGIRLSGGQRQRIGIARALYKQADVIIFDEATSALDDETEQSVIQAIDGLSKDLTLFIIAHRLTTLKNCTQIIELGDGGVLNSGSYQDIVNHCNSKAALKNEII